MECLNKFNCREREKNSISQREILFKKLKEKEKKGATLTIPHTLDCNFEI